MQTEVFQGILIPFLGTTLGSACAVHEKQDELGVQGGFPGMPESPPWMRWRFPLGLRLLQRSGR